MKSANSEVAGPSGGFQSPYLEIRIISAEELRTGNRPMKKRMGVVATVRTDPSNCQSTAADEDGGRAGFPRWPNHKLLLPVPAKGGWTVTAEVRRKTTTDPTTSSIIGAAKIPMSDVVGDYIPPSQLHLLSYRLVGADGQRNGIINLSIKMVGCTQEAEAGVGKMETFPGFRSRSRFSPVSTLGGAVTGIPVSVPRIAAAATSSNLHPPAAMGIPTGFIKP